ncbi:hypothetical protein NliqN6_6316 [Naganishia liquefaciens]|uniref:HhH-GPD domain-containing protein n=1 Tax=Naganishia liquefaciens TaxID=104408 RepID=A0A8H3U164_9TREE|nr:hypothetical protein NliqN6_6316 [Naganishia liquefaciens]
MPLTRSASQKSLDTPKQQTVADVEDNFSTTATPVRRNKRSLIDDAKTPLKTPLKTPTPRKRAKNVATTPATPAAGGSESTPVKPLPVFHLTDATQDPSRIIPGKLGFEFEEAKRHLIGVDPRFEQLFGKLKCKPFENLEAVDPFRSLCTSIVGQQVSWLAARAINHRFRRLFDPSLPEKADDKTSEGWGASPTSFPSPADVLQLDVPQLKSAGLSTRKAEYVRSLAEHFVEEKLTASFLETAPVEEVSKALIDIRGIGQWTVDMFLMFTLRRPDILPVGDLGVQKGLMKWVLAAHSQGAPVPDSNPFLDADETSPTALGPDASSIVPAVEPKSPEAALSTKNIAYEGETVEEKAEEQETVKRTLLSFPPNGDPDRACPLSEGFSVDVLKSRMSGKKPKGGAYLSPAEMAHLTQNWAPYRSLGVYYMWAVEEESD